jgi:hypothetical protein
LPTYIKSIADKGFEIISISLDVNAGEWRKAIEKDEMTWINVSDLKRMENKAC